MLSILFNWIYMGSLVFVMGMALIQGYLCIAKKINKGIIKFDFSLGHVFFAGILGCTLYAQIVSLFYRVNWEANAFLIVLALLYCFWQRVFLKERIGVWLQGINLSGKRKGAVRLVSLLAVIAFALTAAGTAKLWDTDWYHAQTIHWIEDYGCVKGVANLFYVLGFNNAQHYFDALFSMKWLVGQSLRGTGGFFSLILFFHGAYRVLTWKEHKHHMADMLAVWEMAYAIIVTAFNTEVYVDTLPNAMVLFILTEWIALLEIKSEDIGSYGFYCLLAVFAVVCKTSVAMIVLLCAYPIYLMYKQKKLYQVLIYVGLGFLIALPWVVTNVWTTGYLVYLFTAIDLFEVPWKVDPAILKYSVDNMVASARNPSWPMEDVLNCGLGWVESWWVRESISHQLLYIGIAVCVLFDLCRIGIDLVWRKSIDFVFLLPRMCAYAGLVYWFFTIPQVKYCWSFLIFPIAFVPMYYWEKGDKTWINKGMFGISMGLLLLYSGFYGLRTLGYMKDGLLNYPLMQADYKRYDLETVEVDGHNFYIRDEESDIFSGYYSFPFFDNEEKTENIVIGENIREGIYFEE